MAPLTDPLQLEQIREALRERRVRGFVKWKRVPAEWLRVNLEGQTQHTVEDLLYAHVENGLEIDRIPETRAPHCDLNEFHFDFRLPINGRRIYIETTLDSTRTGPTVTIVSIHDA